jgi:hypothetical protein
VIVGSPPNEVRDGHLERKARLVDVVDERFFIILHEAILTVSGVLLARAAAVVNNVRVVYSLGGGVARGKTATPPKATARTGAYLTFEQNLAQITHLVVLRRREAVAAKAAASRMQAQFIASSRLTNHKKAHSKLPGLQRRVDKLLETFLTRIEVVGLWQIVMLVTCVEAYLQDVLAAAARVDPTLMSKPEHVMAPYGEVVAAPSLEVLANDLRARWARGWLNSGGPTHWMSRLHQLGARGYPDDLAVRLERIWGIRHVVVHSAGVATTEFVRLHPGVVTGPGERVRIKYDGFGPFLGAAQQFLDTTEQFFVARYPSLVVDAPIKARK